MKKDSASFKVFQVDAFAFESQTSDGYYQPEFFSTPPLYMHLQKQPLRNMQIGITLREPSSVIYL